MTKKYFDSCVPTPGADAENNPLKPLVDALYDTYNEAMGQVDFTAAAAAVQELASRVNLYVEESAPWNLAKSEETQEQLRSVIYNSLEAIRVIALYMAPFMPRTSAEVFKRLDLGDITAITDIKEQSQWGLLPSGNTVTIGDPLYPRLDADAITLEIE